MSDGKCEINVARPRVIDGKTEPKRKNDQRAYGKSSDHELWKPSTVCEKRNVLELPRNCAEVDQWNKQYPNKIMYRLKKDVCRHEQPTRDTRQNFTAGMLGDAP